MAAVSHLGFELATREYSTTRMRRGSAVLVRGINGAAGVSSWPGLYSGVPDPAAFSCAEDSSTLRALRRQPRTPLRTARLCARNPIPLTRNYLRGRTRILSPAPPAQPPGAALRRVVKRRNPKRSQISAIPPTPAPPACKITKPSPSPPPSVHPSSPSSIHSQGKWPSCTLQQ